jgi:hypothetical protein
MLHVVVRQRVRDAEKRFHEAMVCPQGQTSGSLLGNTALYTEVTVATILIT